MTDVSDRGKIVVRVEEKHLPDGEWAHVQLAPDKWAMIRTSGDTIVYKREKPLGDIEFEIERLRSNGEFENG